MMFNLNPRLKILLYNLLQNLYFLQKNLHFLFNERFVEIIPLFLNLVIFKFLYQLNYKNFLLMNLFDYYLIKLCYFTLFKDHLLILFLFKFHLFLNQIIHFLSLFHYFFWLNLLHFLIF